MAELDPDVACRHLGIVAHIEVTGLTHDDPEVVLGYMADIRVQCGDCEETFRWTGVRAGLSHEHPTCSVDEESLLAPLRPSSEDRDFGLGLPGYSMRAWAGRDESEVLSKIRHAIQTPGAHTPEVPREGRVQWQARAVMAMLDQL